MKIQNKHIYIVASVLIFLFVITNGMISHTLTDKSNDTQDQLIGLNTQTTQATSKPGIGQVKGLTTNSLTTDSDDNKCTEDIYNSYTGDPLADLSQTSIASTAINGYEIMVISHGINIGIGETTTLCLYDEDNLVYKTTEQSFYNFADVVVPLQDRKSLNSPKDFEQFAIRDLNENGIPELVFYGWSGGAHCCHTGYIIELSKPMKVLLDLNTGSSPIDLIDKNQDGIVEIVLGDSAFNYWNSSHATSPMPEVVLSYNKEKGQYIVNTELMRKQAPSQKEIETMAANIDQGCWKEGYICSQPRSQQSRVPWSYALDLIYSGNAKEARQYIDLAWHDNETFESKEDFWDELYEKMSSSEFFDGLFLLVDVKTTDEPCRNGKYKKYTGQELKNKNKAEEIVNNRPEVIEFIELVKKGKYFVRFDHMSCKNIYVVQVAQVVKHSDTPDPVTGFDAHTATFDWYYIDLEKGTFNTFHRDNKDLDSIPYN